MHLIDQLHRWTGGLIGLILVLLGLTGAVLVHSEQLFRPASTQVQKVAPLADIAAATVRSEGEKPSYILFASGNFPFHRVVLTDGSGRYLDKSGTIVNAWKSRWERPELWLFDLHRYLLMGHNGETIVGI